MTIAPPPRPAPPQDVWIGFDPASDQDVTGLSWVYRHDADIDADDDAAFAEARRTGILIAIGFPAGIVVTWLFDLITGGPGLGAMVGL